MKDVRHRFTLLTLIFLIGFISCKKESATTNSNVIPPVTTIAGDIYLDKIRTVDLANPTDTLLALTVNYDNIKRVTSMETPGGAEDYTSYTYSYNGNDTLPFKTVNIDNSSDVDDTLITFHSYDGEGRNLKDSVYEGHSDPGGYDSWIEVHHYSYAPGKRYGFSTFIYLSGGVGTPSGTDTAFLDANNNIISSKIYFESFSNPGTYEFANTSNITYDDHISPFSFLSNFKAHQSTPSGETLFFDYFSHNNILTIHENAAGIPNDETYSYTYGTNGLPATATTDGVKLIYSYRSL